MLADADDGHEAAGGASFFAVTEKEIAAAGSTHIANRDVLRGQARVEELGAIGFAKVEQYVFRRGLVAGRGHVEPLQGIGFVAGTQFVEPLGSVRELRAKLRGDFRAHFVATSPDGGADGGEQVLGFRAELHLHLADGLCDDTLQRAAPARVNCGNSAFFEIGQENWNAVGSLDGEKQARTVGSRGVTAARLRGKAFEEMDDVRVNLPQGNESEVFRAKGGLEEAAVL